MQPTKHTPQMASMDTVSKKGPKVKRQQITDTMLELEQVAKRGDQGSIYVAVNKLAPWKPAVKPSIRGASGELIRPAQQLQLIYVTSQGSQLTVEALELVLEIFAQPCFACL